MQTRTHTHSVTRDVLDWMEPRARIRHNLDTVGDASPLIKLMSYEHREDAVGGAGKGTHPHTHAQCPTMTHRMDGDSARIGHKIDTRRRAPTNQINGIEHREDTVGGGGREQCSCKHPHTHTQCYS